MIQLAYFAFGWIFVHVLFKTAGRVNPDIETDFSSSIKLFTHIVLSIIWPLVALKILYDIIIMCIK